MTVTVTKRLYYANAYLTQFEADVQKHLVYQKQPAVVLTKSVFYPTGGGQPYDTGTLNDILVTEVLKDEQSGQVIHVLSAPLKSDTVVGKIDWERRFDFMQQHTGQHVLSQALLQVAQAETVGFHLSQTYATLDISGPALNEEILAEGETLANQIIYDNRAVTARFVSQDILPTIPLRKQPIIDGPIRVVEIENFDWSACGGTHVAQTGEIGLIKILKTERKNRFLRLTFLCGKRALRHYDRINRQMRDLALSLSVSVEETLETVQRQSQALKQAQKERDQFHKSFLVQEANMLFEEALLLEGVSVINRVFDNKDIGEVRQLAQQIAQHSNCIVLFGVMAQKGQLLFTRSANLRLDMTTLLRAVQKTIGGGGGGSSHLAQGGGPEADKIPLALAQAQDWLANHLVKE